MKSLMFLEAALLEGKTEDVSAYFAEIDRQTANDRMEKAGLQFGFKTTEIMGMRVAKMEDAARILGYSKAWGLSKLLDGYQIMTYKVGSVLPQVVRKLREEFSLSPKDNETTFITWDGFLIAGMYGQNEEAKKIKVYLLKMDTVGRVAMALDPKFEIAAKMYDLKRLDMTMKHAYRIDGMKDGAFKDACIEDYEKMSGRKMPKSRQLDLLKK